MHDVVFKFCTSYIIADIKAVNKLCVHYNSHSENVKVLCHDCNCPTDLGNDPRHQCEAILKDDVQELVNNKDTEGLKQISQHKVENAMYKLLLGGIQQGIHGACPPDPMHTVNLGLMERLCECLKFQMGGARMSRLDSIIQILSTFCQHQSDRNMPRTNFPKGISNLTKLSASEMPGVLLCLLLALSSASGKSIYLQSATFSIGKRKKNCVIQ